MLAPYPSLGSKSDGADLENPQVLHYSQLALDLRSAIAAVAMSLLTAAEIPDLPCLDITSWFESLNVGLKVGWKVWKLV